MGNNEVAWEITRPDICQDGFETTYVDLFERYATSDIGIAHGQQDPRYAQTFAYDFEAMHADLGPDVHPVEHGRYTHNEVLVPFLLTQNYLADGEGFPQLTSDEIVAIRIAAYIHDFGESEHPEVEAITGEIVGDIAFTAKTKQHAIIEARVREYIYELFYDDVPIDTLEQVEAIIREDDDELATRAFAVVERIGYYMTGLRAGYLALLETRHRRATGSANRDDESYEQLRRLAIEVSSRHREGTLPDRIEDFPYAGLVLKQTTRLYETINHELQLGVSTIV